METRHALLTREQADCPLRADAESDATGDVEGQMSADVDTRRADPEGGEPERRSHRYLHMWGGGRRHRHHRAGVP
jgi:hypothetical protein